MVLYKLTAESPDIQTVSSQPLILSSPFSFLKLVGGGGLGGGKSQMSIKAKYLNLIASVFPA